MRSPQRYKYEFQSETLNKRIFQKISFRRNNVKINGKSPQCYNNIGIKHAFPCINVCQVPREMLKTEAVGTWQMLMYWKTMFDRCYCINSTIYLLKFGKLYGTIFCHRLTVSERVHIF